MEKLPLHSLTHFQTAEKKKKNSTGKKTRFSLTHSILPKKVKNLNFSGEKKYGAFAWAFMVFFKSFIKSILL